MVENGWPGLAVAMLGMTGNSKKWQFFIEGFMDSLYLRSTKEN